MLLPGANAGMTAGPVLALLERCRPRVYYAGGVGLLGRFDAGLPRVLRRAKALGALTYVDVVSPFGKSWSFLRPALPWTDVFHCNADEAAALAGTRDPGRAAARIRRMGAANVLVTLGGAGTVAALPGAVLRLPAFKVRAADPTGAGDAFSAGIIFELHERSARRGGRRRDLGAADWRDILVYASACGAVCATGVGTTTAVAAGRVAALLARQGTAVARAAAVTAEPGA